MTAQFSGLKEGKQAKSQIADLEKAMTYNITEELNKTRKNTKLISSKMERGSENKTKWAATQKDKLREKPTKDMPPKIYLEVIPKPPGFVSIRDGSRGPKSSSLFPASGNVSLKSGLSSLISTWQWDPQFSIT